MLSSEATKADGQLMGAFSFKLPSGADPASLDTIYTFGPLSSSGGLMQHEVTACLANLLHSSSGSVRLAHWDAGLKFFTLLARATWRQMP